MSKKMKFNSTLVMGLFSLSFLNLMSQPKDYLNVPGPLYLEKETYYLIWSSHPTSSYIKQEYLTKQDNINNFNRLLLLEVYADSYKLEEVIKNKMRQLEERKKSDKVVNYRLINNKDKSRYILDFLVSEPASSDSSLLGIVEWNAYRYEEVIDKLGRKGILLFGISMRSYNEKVNDFFESLKTIREEIILELIKYKLPEIVLPDDKLK